MLRRRGKRPPETGKTIVIYETNFSFQHASVEQDEISVFQSLPTEMKVHVFSFLPEAWLIKASWTCKEHREIIYTSFGPQLTDFQTVIDSERDRNSFISIAMRAVRGCLPQNNQINQKTENNEQRLTQNSFTLFAEFKKEVKPISKPAQEADASLQLITYGF